MSKREQFSGFLSASVLALAAGLGCAPAQGQTATDASRPRLSGRNTATFDFETPTPYEMPNHWSRGQNQPGYPPINQASLDETMAHGGKVSLSLPTRGGSTRAILEAGVIPVFADADYKVTAWLRTSKLAYARAVVIARLLDGSTVPIPGGERMCEPVVSEGAWREVSVEVSARGLPTEAAYIQLEVRVLQPREAVGDKPHKHESLPEDFAGTAWFDDINVVQLARIDLTTDQPGDIFVGKQPKLKAIVRDLTGERMRTRVTVLDIYGRTMDRYEQDAGSGRIELSITPNIDRYGWYRAVLEVLSGSEVVGSAKSDFIACPAVSPDGGLGMPSSPDAPRLGVTLNECKLEYVPHLVDLIERLGAGAMTVPVWTSDLTKERVMPTVKGIAPLVESIAMASREVTFALAEPPGDAVAPHKLDRGDPWAVLREDKLVWWPYIDQFFDRYGQRVRRWQIGATGSQTAAWRADLAGDLDRLDATFSQLITAPVFVVPSRIEYTPSGALDSKLERTTAVASAVSADLSADAVQAAVTQLAASKKDTGADHTFVFERAPEGMIGYGPAIDDLCRKTIELWAASGTSEARTHIRAAIEQPWEFEDGRPRVRPEFAAWRTLIDELTGRVVIGEFPVVAGVKCYILAPAPGAPQGRGGALVAWNSTASPENAVIEAHLGSGELTMVDRFGNRTRLQKAIDESIVTPGAVVVGGNNTSNASELKDDPASTVRIRVGASPVFIEGVDVELAKFVASLSINPGFLTSTTQRQDATVDFVNPWQVPITGQITIVEPVGTAVSGDGLDRSWKIVPRVMRFSALPGAKVSLPMTIAFGGLEEAGRKRFVLLADINADRRAKGVRIVTGVTIGLPNLKIELNPSRSPSADGPDAVVEVRITNLGTTLMDTELTAFAPKLPRASATITSLRPGHQTVRRFVFPGAAADLRGQRIIVSVTNPEDGTRLNASAIIP